MTVTDTHPRAWYVVACSRDLRRGRMKVVEVLDREILLWRDASGRPHAMHRYCPHLGAAFDAGRVKGDRVECKGHRWEFGSDGRCAHIPGVRDIPTSAAVKSWRVAEAAGFLWIDHDSGEAGPPVPDLDPHLYTLGRPRASEVAGDPDVVLENSLDVTHLTSVHYKPVVDGGARLIEDAGDRFEFESDIHAQVGRWRVHGTNHVTVHRGTIMSARVGLNGREVACWMAGMTPIAPGRSLLGIAFWLRRLPGVLAPFTRLVLPIANRDTQVGAHVHDAKFWACQKRDEGRVLLPEEGLFPRIRRYYHRQCGQPAVPGPGLAPGAPVTQRL